MLYFLIALAAAVGLYLVMDSFSSKIIYERFTNSKAISKQTEQELENFREHVAANELSTGDTGAINDWIFAAKYVLMNVYKNEYLVYSNYPGYIKNAYGHPYLSKVETYMPLYQRLYEVEFSDGMAQVGIYTFAASKISNAVQISEMVLAFACFVLIFLAVFSSKFKYISKLQNEMEIIGSGNLGLPVTIKGNDEIACLARGIDEMRKSFLERIKNEEEARRANSELITSISHDLRTPLTILIGNLDVVANRKYKSEGQLVRYIENSRKKAYQIKELSDKLFEYFLVFGGEFQKPKLEGMEGTALLAQLAGEYALSLEDQGFHIDVLVEAQASFIEANVIAVRRVFDNLFGNIEKYAVPGSRIEVSISVQAEMLSLRIDNIVQDASQKVKSTNIGLATCEKIMAQHGGTFAVTHAQGHFCVTAGFPIKRFET